jgi:FkbM family methyltransferase
LALRERIRDMMTWTFTRLPQSWRLGLYGKSKRIILWIFFHLENRRITVTSAGPRSQRFRMKLCWQAHIVYALDVYEPEITKLMRENIKAGDYCIDAGAHLGFMTIVMAKLVGDRGLVSSFEPVDETFEILKENVALNRLSNVDLQNAALAEESGQLSVFMNANQELSWTPSAVGYAVGSNAKVISAPAFALDDFMRRSDRKLAAIKIDVEGAELGVLRGAERTLREMRPVIFLEIHDWGSAQSRSVTNLLSDLGYDLRLSGTREREAFCLALPATQSDRNAQERATMHA